MLESTVRAELERAAGKPGRVDEPLAPYTTLGCGGAAALLLEVDSSERLAALLAAAGRRDVPWFIIGRGSNLLVADSGWPGLVVKLAGDFKSFSINGERIESGAAVNLSKLAATAAQAGLSGLETLAQIPGTLGGAVAMNAGAFGAAIADVVIAVEVAVPGATRVLSGTQLRFSYRDCELPADAVVSRVTLELAPSTAETVAAAMKGFQSRRRDSQPAGSRTCGSVFKNPPGASAGRLLDEAGCKGMRVGDAEISTVHANFIVNTGAATAADVLELMRQCRRRVFEKSGNLLEPEVRLLGDMPLEPLT